MEGWTPARPSLAQPPMNPKAQEAVHLRSGRNSPITHTSEQAGSAQLPLSGCASVAVKPQICSAARLLRLLSPSNLDVEASLIQD